MKKKIVLAFSGGLDTSYCVKYLKHELNFEVHSVSVHTGGFDAEALKNIEERAYQLGVTSHTTLNKVADFYEKTVKYLIFGNVLRNNTYPLSVSAERIFQALAIIDHAKQTDAQYIAHGSTGAGNDQVRFDLIFHVAAPEITIITPIREQKLSRKQEIDYLKKHGINISWEKAKYSINKGLWGTSVGGDETLTSHLPLPESAFPSPLKKQHSQTIDLVFEQGELAGINQQSYRPVAAVETLTKIAEQYAVGRDIHVGDTIIGIKGRVGFEAPAPLIIIKAHHTLEKHVLTKWQLYWKEQLANWYGMLLHEGQYLDPVMRNIEKFLTDTQQNVSGTVHIRLSPHRFDILGISSKHDLMNPHFGSYGEMNRGWSAEDVKGFTKILANQIKIYYQVNKTAL